MLFTPITTNSLSTTAWEGNRVNTKGEPSPRPAHTHLLHPHWGGGPRAALASSHPLTPRSLSPTQSPRAPSLPRQAQLPAGLLPTPVSPAFLLLTTCGARPYLRSASTRAGRVCRLPLPVAARPGPRLLHSENCGSLAGPARRQVQRRARRWGPASRGPAPPRLERPRKASRGQRRLGRLTSEVGSGEAPPSFRSTATGTWGGAESD